MQSETPAAVSSELRAAAGAVQHFMHAAADCGGRAVNLLPWLQLRFKIIALNPRYMQMDAYMSRKRGLSRI